MLEIYDDLEALNKRHCEFCEEFVDEDDFNYEYGGCIFCMENDTTYNEYINKRNAREERADLMRDYLRDEGR
jgi:hypothetical protein